MASAAAAAAAVVTVAVAVLTASNVSPSSVAAVAGRSTSGGTTATPAAPPPPPTARQEGHRQQGQLLPATPMASRDRPRSQCPSCRGGSHRRCCSYPRRSHHPWNVLLPPQRPPSGRRPRPTGAPRLGWARPRPSGRPPRQQRPSESRGRQRHHRHRCRGRHAVARVGKCRQVGGGDHRGGARRGRRRGIRGERRRGAHLCYKVEGEERWAEAEEGKRRRGAHLCYKVVGEGGWEAAVAELEYGGGRGGCPHT